MKRSIYFLGAAVILGAGLSFFKVEELSAQGVVAPARTAGPATTRTLPPRAQMAQALNTNARANIIRQGANSGSARVAEALRSRPEIGRQIDRQLEIRLRSGNLRLENLQTITVSSATQAFYLEAQDLGIPADEIEAVFTAALTEEIVTSPVEFFAQYNHEREAVKKECGIVASANPFSPVTRMGNKGKMISRTAVEEKTREVLAATRELEAKVKAKGIEFEEIRLENEVILADGTVVRNASQIVGIVQAVEYSFAGLHADAKAMKILNGVLEIIGYLKIALEYHSEADFRMYWDYATLTLLPNALQAKEWDSLAAASLGATINRECYQSFGGSLN
jgi:hypothetical protein